MPLSEYVTKARWVMEGRVRYDQIVRDDLPIAERFNETAYRRFVKTARISDVHDMDTNLVNLKCAIMSGGKLCFTNVGALFFRINDEDVEFRHAGIVCVLFKGTNKAYVLDAKELNGDIVSNVDDAVRSKRSPSGRKPSRLPIENRQSWSFSMRTVK